MVLIYWLNVIKQFDSSYASYLHKSSPGITLKAIKKDELYVLKN